MNIKLLRPTDFNERLREHGVDKRTTIQKVCRTARDETRVKELLDEVWSQPEKAHAILVEALDRNQDTFEFEKALGSR